MTAPLLALATSGTSAPTDMLRNLALIMCVAAVTTVLFQRIRQPVVLGYLLAGLIVGPHLPVPLFADEGLAHELSELGVVLLMFSLGLEFSLRTLVRVIPTAGVVAVIQCSLMLWLGYVSGRAFGWTVLESLFAGSAVAISSTTIIVKALAAEPPGGEDGARLRELVFGVLIVEDLIAILLLAVLTPVATGVKLSAGALAFTVAKLGAFLALLMAGGLFTVPRFVRYVARIGRTETVAVASVGICFAFALLARYFGYSVALGAFLGGALVAESGESKRIEPIIEPVRDVFAAVFFVSVGMLIDPALVLTHAGPIVVLTLVVVVGKTIGVTAGAFLAGSGVRTSVQAGMSLAQIGEFSFIIAGVGTAVGAIGSFLYPVAVAVSALTTLLTPALIRSSGRVASFVDRRLPAPLQTFASLYGSWIAELRATPEHPSAWGTTRKLVRLLLVDVAAIAAAVVGVAANRARLAHWLSGLMSAHAAHAVVFALATVVAGPFLLGAVRVARALGMALAVAALPKRAEGALDLAAAPRRALLVALQLTILLVVGIPLAAITQPFVGSFPVVLVVLVGLLTLVWPLWRSAANLEGHVRAGAQVVLEALARQTAKPTEGPAPLAHAAPEVKQMLPGLGETIAVTAPPGWWALGRTLAAIDLRAVTGATIVAIERGTGEVIYPGATDQLRAGDRVVLTGTADSVAAASALLADGPGAHV